MTLPDCAATVQCPACKFPLFATRPALQQTYRARSCQDFRCSITIGSKMPACVSWDAALTAECTPHISQSECLVIAAAKEHSSHGVLLSLEGTGAYHELPICCPQSPTIHSPFISSFTIHVRYINQIPTIPLTELWHRIPLPPSCHPSEVPDHTDLYHQPPTLQQGRSSSHMNIAALSELSMCAYTVPCCRAVTSKTSLQEQAPQHQEERGMRMDRPCQRVAMQLPKASPLRQQQLQSMLAPAALPLQWSQGCIIGSRIGQGRCQQLTRMCYDDLLAVILRGRIHRLSAKADGGFQGEQGYMATLCTCCQRICLYYGDMLRWREPERGPSSQSCESQGRAAPVRVPGTVPIANSGGIAPNALSPRQSKNKLLHIENAATYSITYTTIPRTQRPPFSLVSTHTQALTRQRRQATQSKRAAVASSSMAFRKILPNNATFGERLHDMKGCPLLDVQISRTGLKNAAAYTTGLHPFTPALPPQTALATTGGRKLSNDSTPQNFTLQHAGGRPSTVDYEQLAPSAFPSAQAPIAATVHSNPKADFAVDGTHGILTDRLSNIQQQVGAQPLSFRNVQQVEQATQEPDASTTSSSSSIPLPADNITTTRQSASGVRPATSSSTSIAFSMATGNSSFMQTTKQGPIDTDGLLTFRHGGMLACTYSNSNMILPPAYATTMMWGTSAPTLARTLRSTSTLAIWSFTLTNSSSLERPATPPFLATAPDHLPVYLLLSAILTLRSLSYLYEAGKPISGLTYTPRNATPTKLNVTKKRKTNQRTGLLEKAKGVQNSMKALKQRLQDKYVMQCQTRLQMEMEHPGAFAAHYLKRAIAKQVRRCIQRSNGYLERKAYRIYRYTKVTYMRPTPPGQNDAPQSANLQPQDCKAADTTCPVEASCPHVNCTAPNDPHSQHEAHDRTAVTCQARATHPQTVPNAPFVRKPKLGQSACHHNTCCNPRCQGQCQAFRALCPEGLHRPEARTTYEQLHGLAHHLTGCQQSKSAWVYCPTYLLSMPNLEDRLIPLWVNDLFNLLQDNVHEQLYLAMPAKDPPDLSVRPCRGWAWVPADYFLRCFHLASTKQALHEQKLYDRRLPQTARRWIRQPIPATAGKPSDHRETGETMSLHYVESTLGRYAVHRAGFSRQDAATAELLGEEWQNESHGQADPRPRVYTTIPREQDSLRTFQGTSTGASCEGLSLVPPPMPSMQGAGKTFKAPQTRGPKAPHTVKRRSKPEQGMRRIDAMLRAAVPGMAPGNAPTKQKPFETAAPQPHNIAAAPHISRNGPQHRPDPLVEPDSEDEDVIMIDHDMEGLSEPCHKPSSPNWGYADVQRQVSPTPHTQWVTPETVGLYCQAQDRGNCALHALNAMSGRTIITPAEAQALLRHPQVPRPADSDRPDCNADGWFRWEAINKLLHYDKRGVWLQSIWGPSASECRPVSSGHQPVCAALQNRPPTCHITFQTLP